MGLGGVSYAYSATPRLILQSSGEREIVLVIDDTGDRKKGQHPDYVKRQYVGNLGKIENGIVAVTA